MTAFSLFMLAIWLWFCLIFANRPFQTALFLPWLLFIAAIADLCKELYELICNLIDLTGEW